jgi:hypothetical protein
MCDALVVCVMILDLLVSVLFDEELDQGVCEHTPSPGHWFCKRRLHVLWRDAAQVRPVGSSDGTASGKEVILKS